MGWGLSSIEAPLESQTIHLAFRGEIFVIIILFLFLFFTELFEVCFTYFGMDSFGSIHDL